MRRMGEGREEVWGYQEGQKNERVEDHIGPLTLPQDR